MFCSTFVYFVKMKNNIKLIFMFNFMCLIYVFIISIFH